MCQTAAVPCRRMEVQVIRSARRRKTIEAKVVEGVLRVSIPATLTAREEMHWVDVMRRRVAKTNATAEIDLVARAQRLSTKHELPLPNEIVWSQRQRTLWGSCTVASSRIRVSSQLAEFPRWVLDYVIVHELAHLEESAHSPRFWALVNRYPLTERSRGYLIAKGAEMG